MTTRHTRAAVLTDHGEPLRFVNVELPAPTDRGSAIVRVSRVSLCGTDVELRNGAMSFDGMLPIVLGHEVVGTVEEVAEGTVSGLGQPIEPGDRVVWTEAECGQCEACTVRHDPVECTQRGYAFLQHSDESPFVVGGFSELTWIPPTAKMLHVPEGVGDNEAAAAGCAIRTVVRALRRGSIERGDDVLIQGAGGLGLAAVALARRSGARTITVIGGPLERLQVAVRFGATAVIDLDGTSEHRAALVAEATGGRGPNLLLDVAGVPGVVAEGIGLAAQSARYVLVGATESIHDVLDIGEIVGKQLTIRGSVHGDFGDLVEALQILDSDTETPWGLLFDAPRPLSAADEALTALAERVSIRPLLDPRMPFGVKVGNA